MESAWPVHIAQSSSKCRSASVTTSTSCWSAYSIRSAWRWSRATRRTGTAVVAAKAAATGTNPEASCAPAWRPGRCWPGCSARRTASSRIARTSTYFKPGRDKHKPKHTQTQTHTNTNTNTHTHTHKHTHTHTQTHTQTQTHTHTHTNTHTQTHTHITWLVRGFSLEGSSVVTSSTIEELFLCL